MRPSARRAYPSASRTAAHRDSPNDYRTKAFATIVSAVPPAGSATTTTRLQNTFCPWPEVPLGGQPLVLYVWPAFLPLSWGHVFNTEYTGSGWGNVMQDMILTAHLTYMTGRTYVLPPLCGLYVAHSIDCSYVFDDYSWDRDGPAYSKFNGKLIPSRIPLSAIISGEHRQLCTVTFAEEENFSS